MRICSTIVGAARMLESILMLGGVPLTIEQLSRTISNNVRPR
jgi:hypothetical protein